MTEPLISPDLVVLDATLGTQKRAVIDALAALVGQAGRAEAAGLARDAWAREEKTATGMPGGFAIPHCRSAAVSVASLVFARLAEPVDFGGKDGPADLVFMIAAPEGADNQHLKLLTKLARSLVKPDFVAQLRSVDSVDAAVALLRGAVEGTDQPKPASPAREAAAGDVAAPAAAADDSAAGERFHLVAITACPTGIAHTYMAADYLQAAADELGVELAVEPQGSVASEPLTSAQIAAADAVIFATDVGVKGRDRFAGKPVVESGVKRAVNEPKQLIEAAVAAAKNPQARRVSGNAGAPQEALEASQLGWGKRIQQALMTGVSYMIPFVAAGGLLIALGFLFGGYDVATNALDIALKNSPVDLPQATEHAMFHSAAMTYLGAVLFAIGKASFGFLLPALAGYIGFGLADRPGIAPGFVAGAIASLTGAGFLGAIVGGLVGGLVAYAFTRMNPPRWLRGLMPVVIIPLVGGVVAGGLMYVVLGRPLAALTDALNSWLSSMNGASAVLLGIILGLMMCFDLGGPINKAAYLFATTNLAVTNGGSMKVMAAVMAAGMVPPLAMALSTAIRPKLYTPAERENGTAAWLLGASFISEGAIPFAAADPLRVIPSMMAGGAVTGALSMALGAASKAPHGGVFVFFAIDRFWAFALAIVVGTVVAGLLVTVLKAAAARKKSAGREQEPTRAVVA